MIAGGVATLWRRIRHFYRWWRRPGRVTRSGAFVASWPGASYARHDACAVTSTMSREACLIAAVYVVSSARKRISESIRSENGCAESIESRSEGSTIGARRRLCRLSRSCLARLGKARWWHCLRVAQPGFIMQTRSGQATASILAPASSSWVNDAWARLVDKRGEQPAGGVSSSTSSSARVRSSIVRREGRRHARKV